MSWKSDGFCGSSCLRAGLLLFFGLVISGQAQPSNTDANKGARAGETNVAASAESAEAAYTRTIEKRAADIVEPLQLADAAKQARVQKLLIAQYRTLRGWHDANDTRRKQAKGEEKAALEADLKTVHDKFIAALNAELTPDQVEAVKDKMTYGKVQFTYKGYLVEYPNLTEEQKRKVLELLKDAREVAMDGGSAEEKSAIFNRYKGKINNYLSAQGVSSNRKKSQNASPQTNPPAAKP